MQLFYMDYYYLVLVVPAFIFSLIAQFRVKSTFAFYSRQRSQRGITGEQAARRILSYYGINDVAIEMVGGNLTDHYDPRSNVIRLSQDVYSSSSIAAIGVACHEAGHAAQHAQGYSPIKVRNAILPICNIGSTIGIPLAVFGLIFNNQPLVSIGLLLYALVAVFQFVTLPVEFNASSRAIKVIDETGILYNDEADGAKKVLKAAAMTYVAALAVSIANLLRMIFITNSNRRD